MPVCWLAAKEVLKELQANSYGGSRDWVSSVLDQVDSRLPYVKNEHGGKVSRHKPETPCWNAYDESNIRSV